MKILIIFLFLLFAPLTAAAQCPEGQTSADEVVEFVTQHGVRILKTQDEEWPLMFAALQEMMGPAPDNYQGANSAIISFPEKSVVIGFVKEGCLFNTITMKDADFAVLLDKAFGKRV